jgi:hypothetical protein
MTSAHWPHGSRWRQERLLTMRKHNDGAPRIEARMSKRPGLLICPTGGLLTGVSSPLCKNISVFAPPKSHLELIASRPTRGAYRDRHGRRVRDAVDAAAFCARGDRRAGSYGPVSDQQHADERCCCGRRSRVVLTPRRWRQVRGGFIGPTGLTKPNPRMTVAKEPGHRGEHEGSR